MCYSTDNPLDLFHVNIEIYKSNFRNNFYKSNFKIEFLAFANN